MKSRDWTLNANVGALVRGGFSLELLNKYRPQIPTLTLLDVGCGKGKFLKQAAESGFAVTGLDLKNYTTSSFPVVEGSASELLDVGQFGVITAWNVIEHLENPWSFFREAKGHLVENGFLMFSLPNVFNLRNRFSFFFKGEFYRYNEENDHRFPFTRHLLKEMLRGYLVKESGYYVKGRRLKKIVSHLIGDTLTGHTYYVVCQFHTEGTIAK